MPRALPALLLVLALAGCGSDDDAPLTQTTDSPGTQVTGTPSPAPTPTARPTLEPPDPGAVGEIPTFKAPPAGPLRRYGRRVGAACRRAPFPAAPAEPLTAEDAGKGGRRIAELLGRLERLEAPRDAQRTTFELTTALRRLAAIYRATTQGQQPPPGAAPQTYELAFRAAAELGAARCTRTRADNSGP